MAATIGGLVALLFWGISDWLASKNSKTHHGIEVNLAIHLTAGSILLAIFLFSRTPWPNLEQFLTLLLAAAFFTAGYIMFIKALAIGQAGIVVPLLNTFPLFAFIASYVFLGITFSNSTLLAMAAVVVGAVMVGTDRLKNRGIREHLRQEVLLSVGGAVAIGINLFILNTVVEDMTWEAIAGIEAGATALFIVILSLIKNKSATIKAFKKLKYNKVGIISGLMIVFGTIGFYAGGEAAGNLIIPAVLASASVLVTSILAAVFDNEKIILLKRIGAVFVVAGVILLNINL